MRRSLDVSVVTLAALAAALGMARPAVSQTVVAGPTATDVTATAGQQFTLPVAVDMTGAGGALLGAYRLSFRWNPSLLTFVSVGAGSFAAPTVFSDSTGTGLLRLAAAAATGATGVFTLANITFRVASTAAADTFGLAFQELTAATTYADLLPSLVQTSSVFCGGAVWGDVDNDGVIKALDAQIVLMHAVGLPVAADTTRGDVDGNGKVDPRDALVILSQVVGLDVTAFRVGEFVVSTCLGSAPQTVAVAPSPLALAAGDVFPASAAVRDASGTLLVGKNLAWSSSDTTIAKVDLSGKITARANGTVTISAAVTPGVSGSATVTVGPRHRWVVNPTAAQGQLGELGSDTYPFSTIAQATGRAAAGDTVEIAPATYTEPLTASTPLVFLGDSTTAGVPVITRPDSIAGKLQASGKFVVRRITVKSSGVGLELRADTVDLSSLGVGSSLGPALKIVGAKRTTLHGVSVSSAGGAGIWVDSTAGGVVTITRASVGGVGGLAAPLVSGSAYNLYAAGMFLRADSVTIDSAAVAGVTAPTGLSDPAAAFAGILTENTKRTLVRHSSVSDIAWGYLGSGNGPDGLGIGADTTVTLEVRDSSSVQRTTGEGVAMRGDTIRVLTTAITDALGDAAVSAGDTFRVIDVANVSTLRARRGIRGKYGLRATVHHSEFQGNWDGGIATGADTTTIDSVMVGVTDTTGYACGVLLDSNAVVTTIDHAVIQHAGYGLGVCSRDPATTGDVFSPLPVGYVAITNSMIIAAYTAVHVHADSLLVQNDSLFPQGWGVYFEGGAPRQTQWARLRNVVMRGLLYQAVYADSGLGVEVVGSTIDNTMATCSGSVSCAGLTGSVQLSRAARARVDSNAVTFGQASGISLSGVDTALVRGNTVTGRRLWANGNAALLLQTINDSAVVTRNALAGNSATGLRLADTVGTAVIDTNLIADDSTSGLVRVANFRGTVRGTWNSVRRNMPYGVVDSSSAAALTFQANNIEGNAFGVMNLDTAVVNASNSWWGNAKGPRCASGCDTTSTGDSVSTNVNFTGFTSVPISGAPAGAPRMLAAPLAAPVAPSTSVTPAPAATVRPVTHPGSGGARWTAPNRKGAGGASSDRPTLGRGRQP